MKTKTEEYAGIVGANIRRIVGSLQFIFIFLKLGNFIDWSWTKVLSPIIFLICFILLLIAINITAIIILEKGKKIGKKEKR